MSEQGTEEDPPKVPGNKEQPSVSTCYVASGARCFLAASAMVGKAFSGPGSWVLAPHHLHLSFQILLEHFFFWTRSRNRQESHWFRLKNQVRSRDELVPTRNRGPFGDGLVPT